MIRRSRALPLLLASAALALTSAGVVAKHDKHGSAAASGKHSAHAAADKHSKHSGKHSKHGDGEKSADGKGKHSKHDHAERSKGEDHCRPVVPLSEAAASPSIDAVELASPTDLETVKHAIDLVQKHKPGEANEVQRTISDPVAKKLVEWVILRSDDMGPDFGRYAAFIRDNPGWPSIGFFRRRAELSLWPDRRDPAAVRRFLAGNPASSRGRFALARVLLADGDREGAERVIREAWRNDELSEKVDDKEFTTDD